MNAPRLGILGGTFDPIHFGHLDAAAAARAALTLDEVLFIPAHDPPHRPIDPRASAFHRFALVSLAIDGIEGYRVSDMELLRDGPSYTVTTLRALHGEGWSPSQLYFVMGADAFAEIHTWYAFPGVLDCANFVVISRPGAPAVGRDVRSEVEGRPGTIVESADAAGRFASRPTSPRIYHVEARTRDVSSTTIRARLAAGESIDDLVPAAVARHIGAHRLYEPRRHEGHPASEQAEDTNARRTDGRHG
jgi:nicotinate-nucleotide adenylyltransferase